MAARNRPPADRGDTKPAGKKPSAQPSGRKDKGKKPRRAGVVQPHGGMLIPGAGGGPQPGSGRPRSAIRARLLGDFDQRTDFLNKVIDGELVTHLQVPLLNVLPHVECSGEMADGKCAGKIRPKDPKDVLLVNFSAKASANVADRLKAHDTQAKYSLGALKGILADQVEENVRKTLEIIQESTAPDQFTAIAKRLRPVWAGS